MSDKTGPHNEELISEQFVDKICKRIVDQKPVRRSLPGGGRVHIDRSLPFIFIYRKPARRPDKGTEKLVKGEASYLIASSGKKNKSGLSHLIENIINISSNEHKAFLIVEIWTKREEKDYPQNYLGILSPHVKIIVPKEKFHTETLEALEKSLETIYLQRQKLKAEIVYSRKVTPSNLPPLISSSFSKKMNCFSIGIEIEPFYQDPNSKEYFPLVLRKFHQGFSKALKLGVYQFSHHRTSLRPTTYQALGRRALVKAVWEVDQKLAEISNLFDFLLLVTPINIDQSWNKFRRSKFEKAPLFYYRPIPVNPSLLKSKLYSIPIENIEDPTLLSLFHEKQIELERSLSMLRDRGSKNFYYGSMQLYGEIGNELISLSKEILNSTSPYRHQKPHSKYYYVDEFAKIAEEEIEYYRRNYPEVFSKVFIREDITGLMVSKGNLLLGKKIKIPESRVSALLQHEVGTHILTYINGRAQPFQQLYAGLAGYDELQEGIAVLSEYLVGGLTDARIRLLAGRVIAASCLIDGATFVDTFRLLYKEFDFAQRIAYVITARIYRGGGLTKDAVYLRGLSKVIDYISKGGELEPLLVGKISSEHVSIVKELQYRKVLRPIPLFPRYLQDNKVKDKLKTFKNGFTILDLINRR